MGGAGRQGRASGAGCTSRVGSSACAVCCPCPPTALPAQVPAMSTAPVLDCSRYVEDGVLDAGICGRDWVRCRARGTCASFAMTPCLCA